MPLPDVGVPLSLNEIHIEAGGSTGTNASINDADIRGLIGKTASTTMSFNEWYGASAGPQLIDLYLAQSTNNSGVNYTWTNTKSVQSGDLVVLFWVSGYANQNEYTWTLNSTNMQHPSSNSTLWQVAYDYTKHNWGYLFMTSSASSLTFTSTWNTTSSSAGMTAIVAIVRGATSVVSESSDSIGGHDITALPALGLSSSAVNDVYGPAYVDVSSPSVEEAAVQEGSPTRDYNMEVSAIYGTAGDLANGYFNAINRFQGGSTFSVGKACTIY